MNYDKKYRDADVECVSTRDLYFIILTLIHIRTLTFYIIYSLNRLVT